MRANIWKAMHMNVPNAVHNIRSLYKLLCSYRVELGTYSKHCPTFKMERLQKEHNVWMQCESRNLSEQEGGIFNGKFNPKMDTIRAFLSKIKTLSSIFKKSSQSLPSCSSCACVNVAEYAFPEISEYPWKCLNKLFSLCHGSEYAWSSYMFKRLLKMLQVQNMLEILIWHVRVTQNSEYVRMWLHTPQ